VLSLANTSGKKYIEHSERLAHFSWPDYSSALDMLFFIREVRDYTKYTTLRYYDARLNVQCAFLKVSYIIVAENQFVYGDRINNKT